MSSIFQKNAPKLLVDRRLTRGCHEVDKWLTNGCQNRLILKPESNLRRSLRDGVYSSSLFCNPLCLFRHMRTGAH